MSRLVMFKNIIELYNSINLFTEYIRIRLYKNCIKIFKNKIPTNTRRVIDIVDFAKIDI